MGDTMHQAKIRVGFTYDSSANLMALGLNEEECAEYDEVETIDAIGETLSTLGYSVDRIGDGRTLMERLAASDNTGSGRCPWDIVFNICEGPNGIVGREGHVPSILECYAIPVVFSDSATLSLCLDKAKTKMVLEFWGISTAPFAVIRPGESAGNSIQQSPHQHLLHQQLPLFIKLSAEGSSKGISKASKITDWSQLDQVVHSLQQRFPNQHLLLEKFLNGREFAVGIIGTGLDARVLFVLEIVYLQHTAKADDDILQPVAHDDDADFISFSINTAARGKQHFIDQVICDDSDQLAMRAGELALRAWRCIGCRDAGRVDVRCDVVNPHLARPYIMEVNPLPGLNPNYSCLGMGSKSIGVSYESLIGQIMVTALKRSGLGV